MRNFVELNGYAEGVGEESQFRPIDEGILVGSLPVTVVMRAVWRTEPGDDDPPGYFPYARLLLSHAEPGADELPTPAPDLYRPALERWDGANIIFMAYTLRLQHPGEHRLLFPRAGVPEKTLMIRLNRRGRTTQL